MAKTAYLFIIAILAVSLTSCKDEAPVSSTTKPVVYVPVPPYKEIASRIAGDAFEVRSLVSESDDPHDFSPTPKQVTQLAQAAILFTGEMPFEETLVAKLSDGNSKLKVFSLTENLTLLEGHCDHPSHAEDDEVYVYVKGQDKGDDHKHDHDHDHGEHDHPHEHGQHDHDHADDGKHDHSHDHGEHDHDHSHDHGEHDHDHGHSHDEHHHHHHELDPHVWLSPKELKTQATTIAGVMKNAAPASSAAIDANLKAVLSDLDALDTQLAEKLAFMKGQTFYVYHGAFAYFAQAYGLQQEAIEIGGKRPEPKRITELVEKAKNDGVKLIFVQPQFDQTSAKALADAIGGQVLMLDPLEEDVFNNLRNIAETIGQSSVSGD